MYGYGDDDKEEEDALMTESLNYTDRSINQSINQSVSQLFVSIGVA